MSPTITIALLSYGVLFLLISPLVNLSLTAAGQTTAGQTEGRVRPRISQDNIFQIMDEILRQLNKTKKMFLVMIVSIIVVVPLTFIITFSLLGASFWDDGRPRDRPDGDGPPDGSAFGIARVIVIVFLLAWIAIGIRQWFVLSK